MDQLSPRGPVPRPPPTPEQRRAAEPTVSTWVTASAGTGKTRVLADRVMRLLLGGTDPRQILCLTFTKAAAAEMVKRVEEDLSRFAVLREAALEAELRQLTGRPQSADEHARARTLLAAVLDLPAGLPIMTIHGFCQSLLKRFPLEAGVVPHFDVLDPRSAADLLREAQAEVLASRRAELRAALDRLAVLLGETTLAEGLTALREDRLRLGALLVDKGGVERLIAGLYEGLCLPAGAGAERIRRAACSDPEIDRRSLLEAARVLAAGTDSEAMRAATIADWLTAADGERQRSWSAYETVFLTTKREPRQAGSIITKARAGASPAAEVALLAEQARVLAWVEREKAATVAERTAALLRVGAAVLEAYDRRKRELAALDFDDLIAASRRLLDQPGIASWVQYKLDQQIDHLLVDEGQDTSPEQWAIIQALSAEIFTGEGARAVRRTLFVVGDEKQSIMSVQGADVATYRQFREILETRARAGRQPWREEPLGRSFRSAKPILDLVDAVFADPEARDGVVSGPDWPPHECFRTTAPGLVEVWPLVEGEPADRAEDWQLPDRQEASERGETRLAKAIARQIFEWRRDATPLASTGQPIRAGDMMVLLPRRGILQDLLIRELKRLQVPVAGADRLALTDEIAVMDLIALGDALLLPEDDLTLAAVLRSPLFGLSEDELFELAHDRGEATFMERLRAFRHTSARFGEAFDRFSELLGQADFAPPFEFYARLLGAGSGRRRLLERLGPAASEPIEAFLAQALAYEQGHPPSLQGFLHWLRADATELIRDPDRPRDEVRVLTCHGAKGLEAPIVFIADASFVPSTRERLLWTEDGLPLWRVKAELQDGQSRDADRRAWGAQLQEHRRLLYVALTRARERLIVTGWQRNRPGGTSTWYELIAAGMAQLGAVRVPMRFAPEVTGESLCYGNLPARGTGQLDLPLAAKTPDRPAPPPAWLRQPAPVEAPSAAPLSPSRAFEDDTQATSPLLGAASGRFRRGRLIHRLLQSLPERPLAERASVLARYLAEPAHGLTEAEQAEIAAEVLAVLGLPELAPLFGPDSRAEVPLAGVVGGQAIFGQVDRLVVTPEAVVLLDYKTNRTPPATLAEVPRAYLRQMAAYQALLEAIWPDRAVRPALLWTEGPRLMALDERVLAPWRPGASQA
jgi:ATP-dependent helicase/nuclease subunit A